MLIGHAGHPEVIGTMDIVQYGCRGLIEPPATRKPSRRAIRPSSSFVTQTTLSVDDTAGTRAAVLQRRFRHAALHKEDRYATTTARCGRADGAEPDSCAATGRPRVRTGAPRRGGAKRARRLAMRWPVGSAADVDWAWFECVRALSAWITASAPEDLVEEPDRRHRCRFGARAEEIAVTREDVPSLCAAVLAE
ncbi:MAG: hypothetical protein R3C16_07780 [Hyphomonadaceae bacterium]